MVGSNKYGEAKLKATSKVKHFVGMFQYSKAAVSLSQEMFTYT